MILRAVSVAGFRNLVRQTVRLGARANVLYGDNGQGKTNFIEAVYFLFAFRSFRVRTASELITSSEPGARLEAEFETQGIHRRLSVELSHTQKKFYLDVKPVRRDSTALSGVGVVLFVPEDLLLPRAAPAERRRFLDLAIFGCDRGYYRVVQDYHKVLRNRNIVLRNARETGFVDNLALDTYDEALGRIGAEIITKRRQLVDALGPRLETLFDRIHGAPGASLSYESHDSVSGVMGRQELAEALCKNLHERRTLDLRRGFSGYGPHNDDLGLFLGTKAARTHGSQGQIRSLVLALKLAEIDYLGERLNEPPLLLLDDVASELDRTRRERLFETIAGLRGQTLITVTDRSFLPQLPGRSDFEVAGGRISGPVLSTLP